MLMASAAQHPVGAESWGPYHVSVHSHTLPIMSASP
jgi:hypothetical protein